MKVDFIALCAFMKEQRQSDKGPLSEVTSFASTTSTGNMILHLSSKHDAISNSEVKNQKILKFFKKGEDSVSSATSSYEFNRDIAMWFCRDLMPFDAVSMKEFSDFFSKNMPSVTLLTSVTLGQHCTQ